MGQTSPGSYAWPEQDEPFYASNESQVPTMVGLPDSWQHYGRWLSALAFAVYWMVQSWKSGTHLAGMTQVNHMLQSLGGLLFILAVCYGVLQFWKHRSGTVGPILCMMIAGGALLLHMS